MRKTFSILKLTAIALLSANLSYGAPPAANSPGVLSAASFQQGQSSPIIDAPVPPDFELPAEIKGDVGAFISIKPKTKGKYIVYFPLDAGLQVFPSEMLSNKTQTVVSAHQAGRYRLLAYTAVSGVPSLPAVTTVVVGNAPPTPPNPNPPGPTPDPVVNDPIWPALSAAYVSDLPGDPNIKRTEALKYVDYYRTAASTIHTYPGTDIRGVFQQVIAAETAKGINLSALAGVRALLKVEIVKAMPGNVDDPNNPLPALTPTSRKALEDAYTRFANLVEAATKA